MSEDPETPYVTVYASEYEMRFGPRRYTEEQEKFIAEVVANRKPLPGLPIPADE